MSIARVDAVLITLLDGELAQNPEHLGVAYLAAELRSFGHTVEIIPVWSANEAESLINVKRLRPRLIGFSLTTVSFARATRLGQNIREALGPETHITCGGPLVTSLGASLLRNPEWTFLDSAVRGDGEKALRELLEAVLTHRPFTSITSLCYRSAAGPVCNTVTASVSDLDHFKSPARDQMQPESEAPVRVATSRGCTSRCAFCNAPHAANTIAGKVWRGRTPENVVEELEQIWRGTQHSDFEFVDSTFEDPGGTTWAKTRIATIAQLILSRRLDITFGCCVQAQNWREKDHWLIELLSEAGLRRVLIGVESGSAGALRRWFKRATPEDNVRAIELFRAHSVFVTIGFIMFHAHSTWDELADNVAFLGRVASHNLRLFSTRMEVYPGTALLDSLRQDNLLREQYDLTLNPFDYDFQDEGIGRLAYAMALLSGEEYASHGTVNELPAHLKVAFAEPLLEAAFAKLRRSTPAGQYSALLEDSTLRYRDICEVLGQFNLGLFQELKSRVCAGLCASEAAAPWIRPLNSLYADKMLAMSDLYRSCTGKELFSVHPLHLQNDVPLRSA